MSNIRIEQIGWDHFNGYLGSLEFVNGVSVRAPTPLELRRIAANIKVVSVEDELQVGPAVTMVNTSHVSAELEVTLKTLAEVEAIEAAATEVGYTETALLEIADKGGIKELRKVAASFDVKAVSISDMVAAILEAQAKAKAE